MKTFEVNKVLCIYHSRDLDGWMSAAIVKKWFFDLHKDSKEKPYAIEMHGNGSMAYLPEDSNELWLKGWDYGNDPIDIERISEIFDKVIMCDISFPVKDMEKLMINFDYSDFIWIDHHLSSIKEWDSLMIKREGPSDNLDRGMFGIRDVDFAACELTWNYFFDRKESDKMPEIVRLLGRYDCFGHKGTEEEQKVLEFQYGARQEISNYNEAYNELCIAIEEQSKNRSEVFTTYRFEDIHIAGISIYKYLITEAKQTYSKAFPIQFSEEVLDGSLDGSLDGLKLDDSGKVFKARNFLAINQERFNPINFGIDYHKNGYDGFACFWYNNGKWNWSLYNDNENVDCSNICKQYGGGGHKGAAGFVQSFEDFYRLIERQ